MSSSPSHKRLLLLGDARQVHLQRWCTYFSEHGFNVVTFSLEDPVSYPGDLVRGRVPSRLPDALRYPLATAQLRRLIATVKPHVISAHFVPNYGLMCAIVDANPWVLSTWGSDIMTDPDKSFLHRRRTAYVLKRAPLITSDAEVMTRRIVDDFGIPEDRVATFPFGVDIERFTPREQELVGAPRILSNRKLDEVYSVSTIIDAFPAIRERVPEATLTVAGDGPLRAQLVARAERSIGAGAMVFVGNVEHHRVPGLLRDHNIYVSTSLSDTTSVSLLEAMACGLFPIVTDIPANREWITHGENGLLVPLKSPMKLAIAVIDAWSDAPLRRRAVAHNLNLIREKAEWGATMAPIRDRFLQLAGA